MICFLFILVWYMLAQTNAVRSRINHGSEYSGQLMEVIGKDGNNWIYLIAYDVMDAETRDLWQCSQVYYYNI